MTKARCGPDRHALLLLGMGADEQMAGYGRHRTIFRKEGWAGLAGELQGEHERLWLRNLGRDDRVVSDLGREPRHPYLDEQVVPATASTSCQRRPRRPHPRAVRLYFRLQLVDESTLFVGCAGCLRSEISCRMVGIPSSRS